MRQLQFTTLGLIAMILAGTAAMAHGTKKGDLQVEHAWAPATGDAAENGAIYLTLVNHGEKIDRLIQVFSPIAKKIELHTHSMKDGVMSMRRIKTLETRPGATTVLKPGGMHFVLTGLWKPLKEGSRFPLVMKFEKAGIVGTMVEVQKADGAASEHRGRAGGAMHDHGARPASDGKTGDQTRAMTGDRRKAAGGDHMKMTMATREIPENLDTATTKLSASKRFMVSISSRLDPIAINRMHSWTLRISTPDGKPVEHAAIEIGGDMPAHRHGLPTAPRVTREIGGGAYLVEGMKFNMTGWWQLRFAISKDGHRDDVAFNLVVR